MGASAVKQGLNVVHYTLELNQNYVGLRYDTIFSGSDTQHKVLSRRCKKEDRLT